MIQLVHENFTLIRRGNGFEKASYCPYSCFILYCPPLLSIVSPQRWQYRLGRQYQSSHRRLSEHRYLRIPRGTGPSGRPPHRNRQVKEEIKE